MNKRPLQIDGETYYFTISFWGDSTTPMYRVKMYCKTTTKFLFFNFDNYVKLQTEDYHKSKIRSFEEICKITYERYKYAREMIDEFNKL